jgi:hypothetical protein
MSPPPTSIDGTDITGATIDGTDVQEITVDGDVVFSAIPDSAVAQESLIAWYPFANAATDVTAGDGTFGDTTDYSGTVNGATQQTTGGVVDIYNQTVDSEYYAFDGSNDGVSLPNYGILSGSSSFSVSIWVRDNGKTGDGNVAFTGAGEANVEIITNNFFNTNTDSVQFIVSGITDTQINITGDPWTHLCITFSSTNGWKGYINGNVEASDSSVSSVISDNRSNALGGTPFFQTENRFNGDLDDFRVYNKELSSSEVNEIISNTDPNA